jgi:hypothetical protein
MFEVIGMIAVWLIGAVVACCAPLLTSNLWANTGSRFNNAILGFWVGVVLLVVYVVVTVVIFIAGIR